MTNCELLLSCPFFNDKMYGMTETHKQAYCREGYQWCGRYLTFSALQREMKAVKNTASLFSRISREEQRFGH